MLDMKQNSKGFICWSNCDCMLVPYCCLHVINQYMQTTHACSQHASLLCVGLLWGCCVGADRPVRGLPGGYQGATRERRRGPDRAAGQAVNRAQQQDREHSSRTGQGAGYQGAHSRQQDGR